MENELTISGFSHESITAMAQAVVAGGFSAIEAIYAPKMAGAISDFSRYPLFIEGSFAQGFPCTVKIAVIDEENVQDLLNIFGFFKVPTSESTTARAFKVFRKLIIV